MEVRLHDSADEFRAVAEPFYRRDPITNTIELTLLRAGVLPEDSLLLTVWNNSDVVGAALRTPPYPLACNAIPIDSIGVVADALAALRSDLSGVRGRRDTAIAFADAWCAATGVSRATTTEQRLYRLGALHFPAAVSGANRFATASDRGLIATWLDLFFQEADGNPPDPARCEQFIDKAESAGDQFILWVVDATPVSMALLRAPGAGVSRIGPVFTPVDRRGNGYGSAVTAAAADLAVSRGVTGVVLFADLDNPTSNAIYQKIGFEPVDDYVRVDFVTVE